LSVSISCSEALAAIRRGEKLPAETVRRLGEEQPSEFFRIIVESLADSFDPAEAAAYTEIMRAWIPQAPRVEPPPPDRVAIVYVLSRVTLGADIKITSTILDAMKKRYPRARIVFVANRKSWELFANDARIEHLNVEYPRSGSVGGRIDFAHQLRRDLEGSDRIVIDPDSRMTQLGLVPVCEPERYFHFSSRTLPGQTSPGQTLPGQTSNGNENLTAITNAWLQKQFGTSGEAFMAPEQIHIEGGLPSAAISLGVGENAAKRIGGEFEARVIRRLGEKFRVIQVDRGAGGEEAGRVIDAVTASGCYDRVRFWEGSFAGFASIISQCDFYAGYDSAGQHAAAAARVSLVAFFKGAPSERFRQRWSPAGQGPISVVDADLLSPEACLERLDALLE
jgi:ADP-heptose:LPS heptosyltransferase